MTIDEAIKALADLRGLVDEDAELNYIGGCDLGIEALKAWRDRRLFSSRASHNLLPGETEG